MGFLDNIFGSESGSAVPGGNLSKPLMIALLALLASRYMSGGSKDAPAASPESAPSSPGSLPDTSPGTVLDGLGGLLKQFQQKGLSDAINSWIKTGPNKDVGPGQISDALGPEVIDALSKRTGIPKDQIAQILSQVLPKTVDHLTPEGRLPTQHEMARLVG